MKDEVNEAILRMEKSMSGIRSAITPIDRSIQSLGTKLNETNAILRKMEAKNVGPTTQN